MSWTYSPHELATSALMRMRLEIGDTDDTEHLLEDEEIEWLLSKGESRMAAQASCCDLIARKFARLVDTTLGHSRVAAHQKYEHYRREAARLRKMAMGMNAPDAGGLIDGAPTGLGIVPGVFSIGMMSRPEGG